MRILLVTHYYPAHGGGIEQVARHVAAELSARGVYVAWMASDSDPCPAQTTHLSCHAAPSWNGIERHTGLPLPLWSPSAFFRLWRLLRAADVLHLHDCLYPANIIAFILARVLGRRILITQHVGAIPYRSWLLRAVLVAANRTVACHMLGGADHVVFISPAVRDYFSKFARFRSPPAYVPNGLDEDAFHPSSQEQLEQSRRDAGYDPRRCLAVFVGRFVERKGLPLVLELAKATPHIDWVIIGDGPLNPEQALPANTTVRRRRPIREVAAVFRQADLLILPSQGEGFPLVVQEAMACGANAMVYESTAAGCPDVVEYLTIIPERAAPALSPWLDQISAFCSNLSLHRSHREDRGRIAHRLWSWSRVADHYVSFLDGWKG